jgi:hypothetical protein
VPSFYPGYYGESSLPGADPGATVLADGFDYYSSQYVPTVIVNQNSSSGRGVWLSPMYAYDYSVHEAGSPGDHLLEQAVAWAADPPAASLATGLRAAASTTDNSGMAAFQAAAIDQLMARYASTPRSRSKSASFEIDLLDPTWYDLLAEHRA